MSRFSPTAKHLKATPLTGDEWEDIKLHPVHGASSLAGIPRLKAFARAVRNRHERIDGRGYPDGLRGDEIPVASRIIAIADAFHVRAALIELARCAGTQFDAECTSAFAAMLGSRERAALRLA